MSLIFDRTERKNKVTRELYHGNGATQFQFLGDETVTVFTDGEVWLMYVISGVNTNGWMLHEKCSRINPYGGVACL